MSKSSSERFAALDTERRRHALRRHRTESSGMTRVFTEAGRTCPCDRAAGSTTVRSSLTARSDKNGYTALQLGAGMAKVKNVLEGRARPLRGGQGRAQAQARGVPRRSDDALIPVGAEITADHFVAGQFVDVTGTSIGQGLRRRHEALELRRPARHARRVDLAPLASVRPAAARIPGKTFKNKKMPGHHGRRARRPRRTCGSCRPMSSAA